MKRNPWKLATTAVFLTMLVPGLAMLLVGCGPEEEEEVIPTPVPVKPTATPVPSPALSQVEGKAEGPVPPTATPMPAVPPTAETEEAGSLIDDFEGGDFDDRWWSYEERTVSFACTPDQPGHASPQAMRLTFEVGAGGYAGCGTDVDPDQWGDARGLSFSWRADQPGLTVVVNLEMEDPTQTYPEAEGLTPFQAELQTPGEEWTPVTLVWNAFAKAEWVGEGGVEVLDPTRVVALYFDVREEQSGSAWFDDLQLTGLEVAMPVPTASTPPTSTVVEPEITPPPEAAPLAGASTLERDFALPIPLFAPDSAWNQTATSAAVLPESAQQILVTYRVLRGDITSLYGYEKPATTWPFMDISLDEYAIPVFRAGAGQQSVLLCNYEGNREWPHPKFDIAQEGGPVPVPAPAGMVRPAGPEDTGADGHLVLYNSETFEEYDFWQATTVRNAECESLGGGQTGTTILEAGVVDFFDVRGPGANPDTYYSARAHGTPLLAGLIIPEDVESGVIAHALSFAIPGPRNTSRDPYEPLPSDYLYPASTTETDFFNTNPYALAAGQRIRLKQTIVDDGGDPIDESQLAPITRMYLMALRTYGAYLVDNAGGFTFYAEDIHTAVLHLSDDEVNALIGQPSGTPLPAGMTKWQVVIEKLTEELELIPIAHGPWEEGQDPATATIEISNFEVVEPARPSNLAEEPTTPTSAPTGGDWWQPAVDTTWQWQLIELPIDQSFDVDMYDIEMFDNDASVVDVLHAQGRKVVCYISVGSREDWRPDKDQFPASVIGKDYGGWSGEKWLDIRQIDLLAPIMRARLDECKAKGFDGIEPDNIDGYTNDTGFPLTYEDQLKYNIWLANEAHARGLSIGLKNDPDQVADLLPYFDWALTEDCFAEGWCEQMEPFVAAGKPVFAAEYTDTGMTTDQFCPQANAMNFSVILKNRDLEAWRQACP